MAKGYIIKTNPAAGTKKQRGDKINIIVSKGPNSFEMPNYVGETRAKAEEDLKNTYKVSSKMITIEEVETFDYAAGTVLEQTPAPGEQYSLNSKTKIVLKVAKETTSIEMPNYVGSTYDFARSNLIEIYGIKEANIELRKTEHLPDGVSVSAGQIVSQTPEVSGTVDVNRTRIVLTVYEPNEGEQNRNRVAPVSYTHLYPGISLDKYEDLLSSCSIYLDCNQGEEVWSSSLHALENGQVLFGLKSTVHQEAYKNLSTITDTVEEMKQQLDTLLQHPETHKELVREQARILKLPEKEALEELFKRLEGGTCLLYTSRCV